jgi:hypothetical protein
LASEDVPRLLPARILNEHVYCPRLAYLEWVDRRFEESADTAEGTFAHRRAHQERSVPPEPGQPLEATTRPGQVERHVGQQPPGGIHECQDMARLLGRDRQHAVAVSHLAIARD